MRCSTRIKYFSKTINMINLSCIISSTTCPSQKLTQAVSLPLSLQHDHQRKFHQTPTFSAELSFSLSPNTNSSPPEKWGPQKGIEINFIIIFLSFTIIIIMSLICQMVKTYRANAYSGKVYTLIYRKYYLVIWKHVQAILFAIL